MIRAKDLHALLRGVVDESGGGGAMLANDQGAILAAAGFEDTEPKVMSAIAAHVWAHYALVTDNVEAAGDLRTLAFETHNRFVALGEVFEASHFVALYSRKEDEEPLADLLQRLAALQQKLVVEFGEALSAAPPEAADGGDAGEGR
mmetsp:Transcript_721/g.2106  ORF Transcript_721/g.2106 Transcript_721/m.2106 type:complete len:146 (-) Transcript_721:28-465(-)